MGYKKHTLRVWLPQAEEQVLLVPLVTWVAPANRGDALFLHPSIHYCDKHLDWLPEMVVGDKAYINLARQKQIRERWNVAVIVRLREDMKLVKPFAAGPVALCPQGEQMEWLGYAPKEQLQWFGVSEPTASLCAHCWERSSCPRQFSHPAQEHEILLGLVPGSSRVAQTILKKVRPWIEPAQSYEKNQLGLRSMFFNSLRLTWMMSLLADTVMLLRAHALLATPRAQRHLLEELLPKQMLLDIDAQG